MAGGYTYKSNYFSINGVYIACQLEKEQMTKAKASLVALKYAF